MILINYWCKSSIISRSYDDSSTRLRTRMCILPIVHFKQYSSKQIFDVDCLISRRCCLVTVLYTFDVRWLSNIYWKELKIMCKTNNMSNWARKLEDWQCISSVLWLIPYLVDSQICIELMPLLCPTLAAILSSVNSCRRLLRILVVSLDTFVEKKKKEFVDFALWPIIHVSKAA